MKIHLHLFIRWVKMVIDDSMTRQLTADELHSHAHYFKIFIMAKAIILGGRFELHVEAFCNSLFGSEPFRLRRSSRIRKKVTGNVA